MGFEFNNLKRELGKLSTASTISPDTALDLMRTLAADIVSKNRKSLEKGDVGDYKRLNASLYYLSDIFCKLFDAHHTKLSTLPSGTFSDKLVHVRQQTEHVQKQLDTLEEDEKTLTKQETELQKLIERKKAAADSTEKLQHKIADLQKTVETLQETDLQPLQDECNELNRRKADLDKQIQALEKERENCVTELTAATALRDQSQHNLDQIQKQLDTVNGEIKTRNKQIADANIELPKQHQKKELQQAQLDKVTENIRQIKETVTKLQDDVRAKNGLLNRLKANQKLTESQLETLNKELIAAQDLNSELLEKKTRADKELEEKKNENKRIHTSLLEIDTQLNALTENCTTSNEQLTSQEQALTALEDRARTAAAALAEAKRRHREKSDAVQADQAEKERLEEDLTRLNDLQQELKTQLQSRSETDAALCAAQSELENARKDLNDQEALLQTKRDEISLLQRQAKALEPQITQEETRRQQEQNTRDSLQQKLDQLLDEIRNLEAHQNALNGNLHSAGQNRTDLQQQIHDSEAALQDIKQENEELANSYARNNRELQSHQKAQQVFLETKLNPLLEQIQQCENEIQNAQIQKAEADATLTQRKKSLEDKMVAIMNLNAEIRNFDLQNVDQQEALDKAKLELQRAEDEVKRCTYELNDINKNKLDPLYAEIADLRKQLDSKNIAEIQTIHERTLKQLQARRQELEELKQTLDQKQAELEQTERNLDEKRSAYNTASQRSEQIESEHRELEAQLACLNDPENRKRIDTCLARLNHLHIIRDNLAEGADAVGCGLNFDASATLANRIAAAEQSLQTLKQAVTDFTADWQNQIDA